MMDFILVNSGHATVLYIISITTTGTSELRLRDLFCGIPLCRQGRPSPSIPRPHSEISQAELPAFRSSSFLGGASSENSNPTSGHLKVKNSNPTSGHLKVKIRIPPLDT